MAKFRIFNIQLLPNSEDIDEVGKIGYRKLFSKFRDLNATHVKDKTESLFHFSMPGDIYIGPLDFSFPAGYVSGNFARYRKTDKVVDLNTDKTLFQNRAKKTAVTEKKMLPFVFSTGRHYLAIDGAGLPKTNVVIQMLEKFFQPVASENFPDHTLTVSLISKPGALERVLNTAAAFKVVDVHMSFPNGHGTENMLRELRDSKAHSLNLHLSSGVSGRMTSIPGFAKDLLRAATTLGWATITYFIPSATPGDKKLDKANYDSRDMPYTFTVRHSSKDVTEKEFFDRVDEKLEEIDIEVEETDEDETVDDDTHA